jgi:hypothetical protein
VGSGGFSGLPGGLGGGGREGTTGSCDSVGLGRANGRVIGGARPAWDGDKCPLPPRGPRPTKRLRASRAPHERERARATKDTRAERARRNERAIGATSAAAQPCRQARRLGRARAHGAETAPSVVGPRTAAAAQQTKPGRGRAPRRRNLRTYAPGARGTGSFARPWPCRHGAAGGCVVQSARQALPLTPTLPFWRKRWGDGGPCSATLLTGSQHVQFSDLPPLRMPVCRMLMSDEHAWAR